MISRVEFSPNWAGGVEFLPDETECPVSFWEGPRGPKGAGGRISIEAAIGGVGLRKLTEFGAAWFLPMLKRMAQGEKISVEEILISGRREMGVAPALIVVEE